MMLLILHGDLLEELLNLLIDEVVDLLGELLSLVAEGLGALDNLARDDLEALFNIELKLLDGGRGGGCLLGLVATSLNDLGEVAAATTVPGEQVGGVTVGDVAEGTLGGNGNEALLQLLGGDGGNGILGILSRLKREVVGQETTDMGRSHGGTGDGVDGVLGADPSRLNAQARGKDVRALSVVGEVGTAVVESRSTNSDRLSSSSGGVLASVGVVVSGSDGEVDTRADGGVDSSVESLGLATTKRHVGDGALEALALTILSSLDLVEMAGGGVLNALHDIGHGTGTVRAEDLDGIDMGLLGNTVLLPSDGTRAVSAVAIAILVGITLGDSLTPLGSALKVDVLDVGTSVNNIGINTLATLGGVEVLVEGTEVQSIPVGDTGETPRSLLLGLAITLILSNHVLGLDGEHGVDNTISLDVLNIGVVSDLLDNGLVEVASIALETITNLEGVLHALEDIIDNGDLAALSQLKALLLAIAVDVLDPSLVLRGRTVINVVLELDDVRVRDGISINGAQDGGGPLMDSANAERGGTGDGGQGESEGGPHDDEAAARSGKGCDGLPATRKRRKMSPSPDAL